MGGAPPGSRARPLDQLRKGFGSTNPCDLSFRVDLVGFRPGGPAVRTGDMLQVAIVALGGFQAVAVLAPDGTSPIGSLAAFPGLALLIECIRRGNSYLAHVEQVAAARCTVSVSRARP